jgi:ABC-type phosphate/phosphonate transport system substrate-binding protein
MNMRLLGKRGIGALCAASVLMAACFASAAAAGQNAYSIGIRMDSSVSAGQAKVISEKTAKVVSERMGISITTVYYNDDASFSKAARDGKDSFIFSWNLNLLIQAVTRYGYIPFISYSAFGTDSERECFYVRKDYPAKTLADIKDKPAIVSDTIYDYYRMRNLLGEKPEDFFSILKATGNFTSIFYPLMLGDTDAVFASETLYNFYKMNNPGAVSNARAVSCTDGFARFFLSYHKSVPDNVVGAVRGLMLNAGKDEAFKEYRPLLKTSKMKFFAVSLKDFKPLLDLMDEGAKKGWDKDYSRWLALQKQD